MSVFNSVFWQCVLAHQKPQRYQKYPSEQIVNVIAYTKKKNLKKLKCREEDRVCILKNNVKAVKSILS